MANPASANLVRSHRDWPGLLVWFGSVDGPIPCTRFRERDFQRARQAAQRLGLPEPTPEAFTDHAEIHLAAPDGMDADAVRRGIVRREDELDKKRRGGVLGVHAVLHADPFDAPRRPKRSPIPLCHASTRETWLDYRGHWRAFVRAYREASAAFRAGALAAVFPDHAFRPPLPLRLEARLAAA